MSECAECGNPYTEEHHIIFRSQFKGLEAVWNKKRLCPDHHRGNKSPHRNKSIDNKYKQEVQQYLMSVLTKDYYTESEIMEALEMHQNIAHKIVKTLLIHKEGYARNDIIQRIMCGRSYI